MICSVIMHVTQNPYLSGTLGSLCQSLVYTSESQTWPFGSLQTRCLQSLFLSLPCTPAILNMSHPAWECVHMRAHTPSSTVRISSL